MINVKHPLEELNKKQESFLESLPDDQKNFIHYYFLMGMQLIII